MPQGRIQESVSGGKICEIAYLQAKRGSLPTSGAAVSSSYISTINGSIMQGDILSTSNPSNLTFVDHFVVEQC